MRLFFTGTGSAFNPALGNNGAFFTHGQDLYLIDCGETLFAKLFKTSLLSDFPGALTVLLTHTHADHCGSLGTLILYAAERLRRTLTVVHPDAGAARLLSLMGASADQYRLVPALDGRGIRAAARQTAHVPAIPAYAYTISDEKETIYYSGDTRELPADILDGLRQETIAHAYQDVSDFPSGAPKGAVHLPLATLCELVEPALRGKFTLMHRNRDYTDKAAGLGFVCAKIDRRFTP
ncbi:MAG: MBL fold metallo-hydrolase [Firmicutes bacterium]|nr:MBL fold metallo-hydrolase [Bacillota bacterium]